MFLKHILHNIVVYFLPVALPSTAALIAVEAVRKHWKLVALVNSLLLTFVIFYSALTLPPEIPLEVEWAFYAMHQSPGSTYQARNLLGQAEPGFLGLIDTLGWVDGIPTVYSGDQSQMRFKLNRKGYLYAFHFDTTFSEVRQLFPSKDVKLTNPVQENVWLEFPSKHGTWRFDQKPGLEVFLVYVSSKPSDHIPVKVKEMIEQSTKASVNKAGILEDLRRRLKAFADCNATGSGALAHELTSVKPPKVTTYSYQAQDKRSVLLSCFVRHEP
jgi:hypothetical protein